MKLQEMKSQSPFHTMLRRVDTEVEKKSPEAGKKMLKRIRSFKTWLDENNETA